MYLHPFFALKHLHTPVLHTYTFTSMPLSQLCAHISSRKTLVMMWASLGNSSLLGKGGQLAGWVSVLPVNYFFFWGGLVSSYWIMVLLSVVLEISCKCFLAYNCNKFIIIVKGITCCCCVKFWNCILIVRYKYIDRYVCWHINSGLSVAIPHGSRQGGAQLPKHSMANL